jgi:hypothetical protein
MIWNGRCGRISGAISPRRRHCGVVDSARRLETKKREAPGRFFHPLLATLITGAARLMLAITERKLIDEGLDWAFCDTDSMAFANPDGMDDHTFEQKVRSICDWFAPLDPFELKGDVLEIEEQNFAPGTKQLEPLYCYAISASVMHFSTRGQMESRSSGRHLGKGWATCSRPMATRTKPKRKQAFRPGRRISGVKS